MGDVTQAYLGAVMANAGVCSISFVFALSPNGKCAGNNFLLDIDGCPRLGTAIVGDRRVLGETVMTFAISPILAMGDYK